jgi:hypothetical protein
MTIFKFREKTDTPWDPRTILLVSADTKEKAWEHLSERDRPNYVCDGPLSAEGIIYSHRI